MMQQTSVCFLDLSTETLSAWHDELLDPTEQQRIAEHIRACTACQDRIAAFERVSWMLRAQREPDLRAQVWRGLQAQLSTAPRPRSRLGGQPAWRAGLAIAAAVLLVALFGSVLASRSGRPQPGTSAKATAASATAMSTTAARTPAASPTAPSTGIPAGWTDAHLVAGAVPRVAFAPTSPSIGYAVIMEPSGTANVSATTNGGDTWQQLARPISNQDHCDISVDPTNARSVALVCTPPASSGYAVLRSFDGAKTWTQQKMGVTANCYAGTGWAGSTLLMAFAFCDGASTQTQLVASVNHGAFVRLDHDGALSGIPLSGQIRMLAGFGSTYYVQMVTFQSAPPKFDNESVLASTDGGATWKTVAFADGGQRTRLYAVSSDAHTWVGLYDSNPAQLAISTDHGQTWHKLPPPWAQAVGPDQVFVTPDETVYATGARSVYQDPDPLYAATPGATQWTSPLAIPQGAGLEAVSWDANGHPRKLWAYYAPAAQPEGWSLISHSLP